MGGSHHVVNSFALQQAATLLRSVHSQRIQHKCVSKSQVLCSLYHLRFLLSCSHVGVLSAGTTYLPTSDPSLFKLQHRSICIQHFPHQVTSSNPSFNITEILQNVSTDSLTNIFPSHIRKLICILIPDGSTPRFPIQLTTSTSTCEHTSKAARKEASQNDVQNENPLSRSSETYPARGHTLLESLTSNHTTAYTNIFTPTRKASSAL